MEGTSDTGATVLRNRGVTCSFPFTVVWHGIPCKNCGPPVKSWGVPPTSNHNKSLLTTRGRSCPRAHPCLLCGTGGSGNGRWRGGSSGELGSSPGIACRSCVRRTGPGLEGWTAPDTRGTRAPLLRLPWWCFTTWGRPFLAAAAAPLCWQPGTGILEPAPVSVVTSPWQQQLPSLTRWQFNWIFCISDLTEPMRKVTLFHQDVLLPVGTPWSWCQLSLGCSACRGVETGWRLLLWLRVLNLSARQVPCGGQLIYCLYVFM